jgi:hypothetical protein
LIITVGKRSDGREIQQCHTFRTMTEARAKQNEIKAARDRGTLVKRDNVTFDDLAQRWLDSRHDIREVTRLGYGYVLKAVREQLGQEKVQDLSRADIEAVIRKLESGNSHTEPSCTRWAPSVRCLRTGSPQDCSRSTWPLRSKHRGSSTARQCSIHGRRMSPGPRRSYSSPGRG